MGIIITFMLAFYNELSGDSYRDLHGNLFKYDYIGVTMVSLIFALMWPLVLITLLWDIISLIRDNIKLERK